MKTNRRVVSICLAVCLLTGIVLTGCSDRKDSRKPKNNSSVGGTGTPEPTDAPEATSAPKPTATPTPDVYLYEQTESTMTKYNYWTVTKSTYDRGGMPVERTVVIRDNTGSRPKEWTKETTTRKKGQTDVLIPDAPVIYETIGYDSDGVVQMQKVESRYADGTVQTDLVYFKGTAKVQSIRDKVDADGRLLESSEVLCDDNGIRTEESKTVFRDNESAVPRYMMAWDAEGGTIERICDDDFYFDAAPGYPYLALVTMNKGPEGESRRTEYELQCGDGTVKMLDSCECTENEGKTVYRYFSSVAPDIAVEITIQRDATADGQEGSGRVERKAVYGDMIWQCSADETQKQILYSHLDKCVRMVSSGTQGTDGYTRIISDIGSDGTEFVSFQERYELVGNVLQHRICSEGTEYMADSVTTQDGTEISRLRYYPNGDIAEGFETAFDEQGRISTRTEYFPVTSSIASKIVSEYLYKTKNDEKPFMVTTYRFTGEDKTMISRVGYDYDEYGYVIYCMMENFAGDQTEQTSYSYENKYKPKEP